MPRAVLGEKLPDEVIGHELMSFLFAGQDSTAVALSSFFCFVAANPAAQAKLVAEIQEALCGEAPRSGHVHTSFTRALPSTPGARRETPP